VVRGSGVRLGSSTAGGRDPGGCGSIVGLWHSMAEGLVSPWSMDPVWPERRGSHRA
jgi:hypothetical protein